MTFVYICQSELDATKHHVGLSDEPARRLDQHNGGKSIHTNTCRPWKIVVSAGFVD